MTIKKEQINSSNERKAIFNTSYNDNLDWLITTTDILSEIKVLITDFYIANISEGEKSLKISFQNGQQFKISVELCI